MLCNAPWSHLWQETTGKIKPCCVFGEDIYSDYNTLQEAFNGKETLSLRKRMLNDEDIVGCRGCTMKQDFDEYDRTPKLRYVELSFDNNYKVVYVIFLVILSILIYFIISLLTKAFKLSDIKIKY